MEPRDISLQPIVRPLLNSSSHGSGEAIGGGVLLLSSEFSPFSLCWPARRA